MDSLLIRNLGFAPLGLRILTRFLQLLITKTTRLGGTWNYLGEIEFRNSSKYITGPFGEVEKGGKRPEIE